MENTSTEKLFSYGTLQYKNVQQTMFGRLLSGKSDELTGFILEMLVIQDASVVATSGEASHPILKYTGKATDRIKGMVFDLSFEELLEADRYEVDDYKRIEAKLSSGITAWVYVDKNTEIK